LFELEQAMESYRFAQRQMGACDDKLEGYIKSVPTGLSKIPCHALIRKLT
jgi:hypothetical protein